jgi:hypothetical protein
MNYIIVGEPMPYAQPNYRGANRTNPIHVDDPTICEYWGWYIHNFGDAAYLHESDRNKAFELIREYAKHGLYYELIHVAPSYEGCANEEFLGIDIATEGGDSILAQGLPEVDIINSKLGPLDGITELLFRYFRPRLNNHLLLQNKADADLFVRVVKEIQAINPAHFEFGEFIPQYLYFVIK